MSTTATAYIASVPETQQLFRTKFDHKPFAFRHTLHQSPMFTMDAVLDLAARLAPKAGRWYFEQGDANPKAGWTAGDVKLPLLEVLKGIAGNQSLVMFKRVQLEPDYKVILDALQEELSDMFGFDMTTRYRDGLMTVLVASPGRVTHITLTARLIC